jgi:hypothetical protein
LRELGIIHWVRRCERVDDGKLRQRTNTYALLPPSQWSGLDPAPEDQPPPEPATLGGATAYAGRRRPGRDRGCRRQ